jgi:glucan phosphoethanolaminetransferase (alkaline phosphatase superfamily)
MRRSVVRRAAAWLLVLVPGALVVLFDVIARKRLLAEYTQEALVEYAKLAAAGAVMWTALAVAAARERGALRWIARASMVAIAFVAIGTQLHTLARYGAYLNFRVALQGSSLAPAFSTGLFSQCAFEALTYGAPVAIAIAVPLACARLAPARKIAQRIAFAIAAAAFAFVAWRGSPDAGWDSGAPPDVLYVSAAGALAKSLKSGEDIMTTLSLLPQTRTPVALPKLAAHPRGRRTNVVLLLNESVRAPDTCSAYDPACASTPYTNALLPARFGFREMRAVDSTTAISIAVMWSGLPATATRASLHTAPLIWEYAHAAGLATGFWTAQNLLFANSGRWLEGLPLDAFLTGTAIEPYATYQCGADDGKAMDRALEGLATMREPYFGVVQLSNTHFPYWVKDAEQETKDLERYRASIVRQDEMIARFVSAMHARPDASRTVIVYVSDHGEAMYERGQIGHTWSVYDEEIRVPMWIDAPDGALEPDEASQLRALERVRVTNLDVMPTLLDLLGLWDDPGVAPFRAAMPGTSLLRSAPPPERAVVLTNCCALFSCATKNWGAMRGAMKLHATQDEGGEWKCFNVDDDPEEKRDLGASACGDLRAIAEGDGRGNPK